MKILIKFIFIVVILSPSFSYALEKTTQEYISTGLTQSLSELNNTAVEMSASNDSMAIKNSQIKGQLKVLQMTLQKVNKDSEELNSVKLRMEQPNIAKAKHIEQLEKNIADSDSKIKELQDQIKTEGDSLTAKQKEQEKVEAQIERILVPGKPVTLDGDSPELLDIVQQKKKEKLAALKMISESQERQVLLQEQIQDFQNKLPPIISGNKENLTRKQVLEKQINQLQDEIVQLGTPTNTKALSIDGAEQDMDQLESSIRNLEKNRNELKVLVVQLQKKAKKARLTQSDVEETSRLQSGLERLKSQTKSLKFDLQELQQEMVRLDKRKVELEDLLRK
ncbi:MAG: hypothetical protein HQL15_01110 [Candidatus Omnitrophica bacterium]|nr:hypothetical protein [Candidatus Omnitrophota bacterium]